MIEITGRQGIKAIDSRWFVLIEQTLGKYVCDCESQWNVVIEECAKDIAAGLAIFATLI